jgi:hypothetical protein
MSNRLQQRADLIDLPTFEIRSPQPSPVEVRLGHTSCELSEANAIVLAWHRHHRPVAFHRFSIKCIDENGVLHGIAIVAPPVARMTNSAEVLEVARLVSDGTPNVCSYLYGACARIAKALGYERIQTFILTNEPGTSLKAAGWEFDGISKGSNWGKGSANRPARRHDHPGPKQRWVKILR